MVGLAVNYTDDTIHCDAGEAGRFAAGRQGFEREGERERVMPQQSRAGTGCDAAFT